jgi:iron transport multicopper oxidase
MPYLLQILNGANVTNLTPSQSVISLPLNKVIQISFPMAMNDQTILDSAPVCSSLVRSQSVCSCAPFTASNASSWGESYLRLGLGHDHNTFQHFFSVVRSAGEKEYIWDNPPRRDVVSVGTSVDDLTTIRFKTDNVSACKSFA